MEEEEREVAFPRGAACFKPLLWSGGLDAVWSVSESRGRTSTLETSDRRLDACYNEASGVFYLVGELSGCTLQHSQRGLDSTVHIVLKNKHEWTFQNHLRDTLTGETTDVTDASFPKRWQITKRQKGQFLRSMLSAQRHLVGSLLITAHSNSLHSLLQY